MADTDTSRGIGDALASIVLASARHRSAIGHLLRLSENEVLAMVHLRRAGELTPTALGRLLSLTSGGTTALVQRLERDGHVVRQVHPRDGRSRLLRLSAEGHRRAAEVLGPLERAIDAAVAELPSSERAAVGGFLARVAGLAEEHADAAATTAERDGGIRVEDPVPAMSL